METPLVFPINPNGEVLNDYEDIEYEYARLNEYNQLCPGPNCWMAIEGNGTLDANEPPVQSMAIFPGYYQNGGFVQIRNCWTANITYLFWIKRRTRSPGGLIKSELNYGPFTITTGSDNCPILSCIQNPSSFPAIAGNTVTFEADFNLDWPHSTPSEILYEWKYYPYIDTFYGSPDPVLSTNKSLTITINNLQEQQAIWWGEAPSPGYYPRDPNNSAWNIGYQCKAYLYDKNFDYYQGIKSGEIGCISRVTSSPGFLYDPNKPQP